MNLLPERIQRRRIKGFKLPRGCVCCTRGTPYGNPFKVGTWAKLGAGQGRGGMTYLIAYEEKHAGPGFVKVRDAAHAVELFREYRKRYPFSPTQLAELRRAAFLACFCKPSDPCHVDVIIEILKAG